MATTVRVFSNGGAKIRPCENPKHPPKFSQRKIRQPTHGRVQPFHKSHPEEEGSCQAEKAQDVTLLWHHRSPDDGPHDACIDQMYPQRYHMTCSIAPERRIMTTRQPQPNHRDCTSIKRSTVQYSPQKHNEQHIKLSLTYNSRHTPPPQWLQAIPEPLNNYTHGALWRLGRLHSIRVHAEGVSYINQLNTDTDEKKGMRVIDSFPQSQNKMELPCQAVHQNPNLRYTNTWRTGGDYIHIKDNVLQR